MGLLENLIKEAEDSIVDFVPSPYIGDEYDVQILSRATISKNGDQLAPFSCKPVFTPDNKQKLFEQYGLQENKEYKLFIDKKVKTQSIIKLAKAKGVYDGSFNFLYGAYLTLCGTEVKNPKDKTKFSEDKQGYFYTIGIADMRTGNIEFEDPGDVSVSEVKSEVLKSEESDVSQNAGTELREMFR